MILKFNPSKKQDDRLIIGLVILLVLIVSRAIYGYIKLKIGL